MELTRRGWSVAGCGLVLAVGAGLFATPLPLAGAAGVGALLLGVCASFVRRLGAERDGLAVSIAVEPTEPLVDESAAVRLEIERQTPDLPLRVVLARPAAADAGSDFVLELDRHESAALTVPVTWSVAGTYSLGPPRVVATDPLGLFVAAYEPPVATTVQVAVRRPSTIHLGHGGERVAAAFGEHGADLPGAGVEPAKLQRYEAGAPVSRIDWKSTARLGEVYVVDPETATDRQTVLLLDHRASMAAGEEPDTPLAYLRHVALAVLESARELGDPVGAYAVGDEGVTVADPPAVGVGQYAAVENAIRALEPTTAGSAGRSATAGPADRSAAPGSTARPAAGRSADRVASGAEDREQSTATESPTPTDGAAGESVGRESGSSASESPQSGSAAPAPTSPADPATSTADPATSSADPAASPADPATSTADPAAPSQSAGSPGGLAAAPSATSPTRRSGAGRLGSRTATRLADGDDEFARALRPFVDELTEYLHHVEDDPLFAAARAYLREIRGPLWTVIVTDDNRREELRQTVKLARRADDRVLVVLAPRVLFEDGDLSDLDRSYGRYREFESFRRELAAMDRVDAMELAPGERVSSVLDAGGEHG